jgi:hypothetical protein
VLFHAGLFSAKVTIFSEERTPRPANDARKRRRRINFDSKHTFFQKEKIKIKEMLAFYCIISIFANGIVHKTLKFNLLLQTHTHPAQKTAKTMHSVFRNHTNY